MKRILAFGDSNTWGFVPGTKVMERYPFEKRWTGILENTASGIKILEEGFCGRTTAFDDPLREGRNGLSSLDDILEKNKDSEAAIVMLGTNDCKACFDLSAEEVGRGIRACLEKISSCIPEERILLISPVFLGEDVWTAEKDPDFSERSVELSHELKEVYEKIAKSLGTAFLAASDFARADSTDSEHLNVEGHKALAGAIYRALKENNIL